MEKIKVILASKSPRRKEYLSKLGLEFEVLPAEAEEDMSEKLSIKKLSKKLGEQKTQEVFNKTSGNRVVIGGDNIVCVRGKRFGKPKNESHAKKMLKSLSGKWHKVYTSMCVILQQGEEIKKYSLVEISKVKFMQLSDDMINDYIASGDYKDKAGAYGVQSVSSKFIEKIKGDYASIVGLPYCNLYKILHKENIV